ncbi:MAG: hypothetical protein IJ769_00750 [Clostridia bacterium]|nr:hypothetical protein [Clostridia bacterium]
MRFKAILAEAARKRYPLSILLIVVGVLTIPFSYLFVHFGLELTSGWWTALSIGIGVIVGCAVIGLGSLVEDIHDISMHTVGYDLELGEIEEEYHEDFEGQEPADETPAEEAASE